MEYVCEVCGYRYKVKEGDPENGIEPGTEFEDLPDTWTCPLCGAGKEDFAEEDGSEYESELNDSF